MLIYAIDDEQNLLNRLHKAIQQAVPEAEIRDFRLGTMAVQAMETERERPDVVFSDIKMPGLDGLRLAVRIKDLSPDTRIVFVTGYSDYALEAFQLHASGYIMKPVVASRIQEELEHILPSALRPVQADRLVIRCFGPFEVFWGGQPISFSRRQTKELFAYLIDRRGAFCSAEEVIAALFGDTGSENMKQMKHTIRNLVYDLRQTLQDLGVGDVLIRKSGLLAIRTDLVDCDYYQMLIGNMDAVNSYRGVYMEQYSWAEMTGGTLHFAKEP
ncbi:MAG: response regulator [Clostridia bacterium]|nr:response regulator [Clostridia bacterium]